MIGTILIAIVALVVAWVLFSEALTGVISMFRPAGVLRQCDACGALVSANALQCSQCSSPLGPIYPPGSAVTEWTGRKLRRVMLAIIFGWLFALAFRAGWMDEHRDARVMGWLLLLPIILLPTAGIVITWVWIRGHRRVSP